MTQEPHQPEAVIDRALQSLRDTQPPTGLEARVAARLAQAANARTITASRFLGSSPFTNTSLRTTTPSAIIRILCEPLRKAPRFLLAQAPFYALAATALLTAFFFAFHHHHRSTIISTQTASSNSLTLPLADQPDPVPCFVGAGLQSRHKTNNCNTALAAEGHARPAQKATLKADLPEAPAPTDLAALALAETLAPSHPAPHMPLTPQEHLLLVATRQGQPMELAELATLRQPATQAAAEARQDATIRRYAQKLLGPLAAAEALKPTSDNSQPTSR